MRLLVVTPYVGSTYGGTSKIVGELVTSLGQSHIDVDLVTTNANDATILEVPLQSWLECDTHRLQYFPCWHRQDFIVSTTLLRWLTAHIKDYDFVHTHTVFSPLISFTHWLCKLHGVPYMASPHGMLEPWALSYKSKKKRFYFNLIEKPGLQSASAIQVTATPEGAHVRSLGFERTVLVHNGLHRRDYEALADPDVFYQRYPETREKDIVLFLGRIDPKKGLDLLASAFATVSAQFPNAHLVIAGPDSIGFLPTARGYFDAARCSDSITFTGMLTGDIKKAALASASVYVAPSYSEGFSMSVLEGMASGLPCIITVGCNFPEAAQNDAALVVEANAEAISAALSDCLENKTKAGALGDRARDLILENYTWEQSAQKLIQFYESVVGLSRTSGIENKL